MNRLFAFLFLMLANATAWSNPGASSGSVSAALSTPPPFLFAVYPNTAPAGQARTLLLTTTEDGCRPAAYSLDTSLMQSQRVVVLRTTYTFLPCPSGPPLIGTSRRDFTFTPTVAGPITVRWDQGGADVVIQTLAARIASRFDVNGMWFDSATTGSGISIHHRRATTDAAFGTWFLFNNGGEARWYAFQSANWQQDGSVLEGLLIAVNGACPRPDLVACAASGSVPHVLGNDFAVVPALVRITFQSATRARADVTSFSGSPMFSAELSKLAF